MRLMRKVRVEGFEIRAQIPPFLVTLSVADGLGGDVGTVRFETDDPFAPRMFEVDKWLTMTIEEDR